MARNGRGSSPRVNMTTTVPADIKARVRAFADYQNNRASRIVENAIIQYLGEWGTEDDEAADAEERRRLVATYMQQG